KDGRPVHLSSDVRDRKRRPSSRGLGSGPATPMMTSQSVFFVQRWQQRQLPLSQRLRCISEGLWDVLDFEVRHLGDDLLGGHPVRNHRNQRGDRNPQTADARLSCHLAWVHSDPLEHGHVLLFPHIRIRVRGCLAPGGPVYIPSTTLPDGLETAWGQQRYVTRG